MMDEFRWVELGDVHGTVFHDLRDEKNCLHGWVRTRETEIYYWIAADGMKPRECPCLTLEEAKRFVETQYLLVK